MLAKLAAGENSTTVEISQNLEDAAFIKWNEEADSSDVTNFLNLTETKRIEALVSYVAPGFTINREKLEKICEKSKLTYENFVECYKRDLLNFFQHLLEPHSFFNEHVFWTEIIKKFSVFVYRFGKLPEIVKIFCLTMKIPCKNERS